MSDQQDSNTTSMFDNEYFIGGFIKNKNANS